MSGFVPVIGVFSESHGETSITLADSSSAVEFDSFGVVVWSPTVVTDNLPLAVVLFVVGVPDETVSTFWQAPASVETVSRDTFIFWL